jgi:hypothetical protein
MTDMQTAIKSSGAANAAAFLTASGYIYIMAAFAV